MNEFKYTIEPHVDGHTIITAYGKTRAGLFTAATHALFEAMKPNRHPDEGSQERTFAVEAPTSDELLARMLNQAIEVAHQNKETCQELRFNLITDAKAEGSFVGCSVTHFDHPFSKTADQGVVISKSEETGEWKAVIRLNES